MWIVWWDVYLFLLRYYKLINKGTYLIPVVMRFHQWVESIAGDTSVWDIKRNSRITFKEMLLKIYIIINFTHQYLFLLLTSKLNYIYKYKFFFFLLWLLIWKTTMYKTYYDIFEPWRIFRIWYEKVRLG